MSTFRAPEGATRVSVQQEEFEVVEGVFNVPDHFDVHLRSVGFKRAPTVVVASPAPTNGAADGDAGDDGSSGEDVSQDADIDSLKRGELFALAKARGIDVSSSDSNDVLRAKLKG